MKHLIDVDNLSVDLHTRDRWKSVVKNVSFQLKPAETLSVVGESGSGKTMLGLSLMGLIPDYLIHRTKGQIKFFLSAGEDGEERGAPEKFSFQEGSLNLQSEYRENLDGLRKGRGNRNVENDRDSLTINKLSESHLTSLRGRKVSMVFQDPMSGLNPVYDIGSQMAEGLRRHTLLKEKEIYDYSLHLLNEMELKRPKEKLKSYPYELSGGERQRIMMAMALSLKPDLLIADEPTTALDVTVQKQILELLKRLQEKYQMAMIFITHDLGLVKNLADGVLVMKEGSVEEMGNVSSIFTRPSSAYTKGLLSCRPPLDWTPTRLITVDDYIHHPEKVRAFRAEEKSGHGATKKFGRKEVLLDIKNVSKIYEKISWFPPQKSSFKALSQVSFKIYKGETLGIVGESGSGKSTLARIILKLIECNKGKVLYEDSDLTKLNFSQMQDMRQRIQIIFQDPYSSLPPRMTIEKILVEPMKRYGIGKDYKERVEKAKELMEQVGLQKNMIKRYPHEFSGGQRQRICIARALTVNPEFLVLDEAVSALDVSVQAQILNLLLDLQEKKQLTYLFISHDLSVVKFMAHHVGVLRAGKIVEWGKVLDIFHRPQKDYTKNLIHAIPR